MAISTGWMPGHRGWRGGVTPPATWTRLRGRTDERRSGTDSRLRCRLVGVPPARLRCRSPGLAGARPVRLRCGRRDRHALVPPRRPDLDEAGPHVRDGGGPGDRTPRARAHPGGASRPRVGGGGIRRGGSRSPDPLVCRPDRRDPQLHPRRAPLRDAPRSGGGRRAPGGDHERARARRALAGGARHGCLGDRARRHSPPGQDVRRRANRRRPAALREPAGERRVRPDAGLRRDDRRLLARSRLRRLLGLRPGRGGRGRGDDRVRDAHLGCRGTARADRGSGRPGHRRHGGPANRRAVVRGLQRPPPRRAAAAADDRP